MKLPFFGKKEGGEGAKGRGYVPIDRVRELTGRGFSEIDTIDVLRREGFSPDEIDRALEQKIREGTVGGGVATTPRMAAAPLPDIGRADFQSLGQTFEQSQQGPTPTFPPSNRRETPRLELPTIEELGGLGGKSGQEGFAVPETSLPSEYYQSYPTEEYIDYVIQEHMQDINDKLNIFTSRYKELEDRILEMSEHLKNMSTVQTGEEQRIVNRIEGFGDILNDVNMRMAGLEKAFKETLPALIESVRALSDVVQRLKREA